LFDSDLTQLATPWEGSKAWHATKETIKVCLPRKGCFHVVPTGFGKQSPCFEQPLVKVSESCAALLYSSQLWKCRQSSALPKPLPAYSWTNKY